ncbi:MAG: bifunctional homocysteine S-methyltransferase/methylenetetrahydrofolate reductase [Deltaproteobacteria bacterium]|nr:bifunctional homocysteine S-methyltransferase/methylenetetrahydrofolate reductase [Deltaproteobacteria bacterium]
MSAGHPLLEALQNRIILGDGAMGTMLYAKGVYINRCYDALNLESPAMIQGIHSEYLQAGCELIETNTFGANRLRLKTHGLDHQVEEINRAGVEIARKAVHEFSQKSLKSAWIAGSMGPLGVNSEPFGPLKHVEAISIFEEQARALENAGVDLFILETFTHLSQLEAAVTAVRSVSSKPIIGMMTITEEGTSLLQESAETMVNALNKMPIDIIGLNCSNGPSAILDTLEIFRPLTQKPIATFPNAGVPKQVGGRYIYLSTPEYFGSFAKKFATLGVNLIGGCCGTTPTHMRRTRDAILSTGHSGKTTTKVFESTKPAPQIEEVPLAKKSKLSSKLGAKKFVVSVEIDPPKGTAFAKALEAAKICKDAGVDCINIADGPRASARMSPMSMAVILERDIGIETIIHYCCRDRNLLGMQSDLLGANALGLRNVLIITGDPPKLGDYPEAASVFDVDAIGLTKIVRKLNLGMDLAGNAIGKPTAFHQGVGCNPGTLNFEEEMNRLQQKVDAGAEYILTQPVYDHKTFEKFLKRFKTFAKQPPLLIGICPLASLKNAEFLHNEVPGMQIPEEILKRMSKPESPDLQREEGIKIAREALKEFRKEVQGTYIMPPFNRADIALSVVQEFIEK